MFILAEIGRLLLPSQPLSVLEILRSPSAWPMGKGRVTWQVPGLGLKAKVSQHATVSAAGLCLGDFPSHTGMLSEG